MGYLCISRRPGERIVLTLPDGREVIVAVCELRADRVRVSIDAPRDVRIMREELLTNPPPEGAPS